MPELPDLEVFSSNLGRKLKGKKLEAIKVMKNAKTNAGQAALKTALEKQALTDVYREGKELRMVFKNKNVLGIHFMLRGKFFWFGDKNSQNNTLVEMYFTGNNNLALTDYQYNARITLNPEDATVPDALSRQVNEKFLQTMLASKAAVKNILLDQHKIRGIGNAYADEILWDAGISPFSIGNKIPPAQIKLLAKSIKKVLNSAIKEIRSADPGIIGGEARSFLLIHNADKKKSPAGVAIQKKMVAGRPTYFTAEQELYT